MNTDQDKTPPDLESMIKESAASYRDAHPTGHVPSAGPATAPDQDIDEVMRRMNNHPLLMTELDDTDLNDSSRTNPHLDALRSIAYDGTPSEVADNFRQQGNDCAKAKDWMNAREYYDKSIEHISGKRPNDSSEAGPEAEVDWLNRVAPEPQDQSEEGQVLDLEEEKEKMKDIEEACWTNRALCNLELKNYGAAKRDTNAALLLNPNNVKALYRLSLAHFSLDALEPASETVKRLFDRDPTNAAGQALQKKIDARIQHVANLERRRKEEAAAKAKEKWALATALKDRGIVVKASAEPPDMEDAAMGLEEKMNPTSALYFPMLMLYPTAQPPQTELIKRIEEDHSLGQHLEYILPLPWDQMGEFGDESGAKVTCYFESKDGGLMKVGKKVKLIKVLEGGKSTVWDGLVKVWVVPNSQAEAWLAEEKKRRGR